LLTLEIQRPNVPPVQVASRLIPAQLPGEVFADEIAVDDSEIVVPVFPGGRNVGVWRIRPGEGEDWTDLRSRAWSGMATAYKFDPGELTFKFTRLPNHRWAAEATYRGTGASVSHFEQDPTSWRLLQTSARAADTPPSARPADAPLNVITESPPLGGRGGNSRSTVIYSRRLWDDRDLVVISDPEFTSRQLTRLVGDENGGNVMRMRGVRIEVLPKPGEGEPIVLAARIFSTQMAEEGSAHFAVLDSMIEAGQLTFAVAEAEDVAVWRLNMETLKFDVSTLNRGDWFSGRAGITPPEAKLSRSGEGQIQVAVTDLRPAAANRKVVVFKQARDAWSFRAAQGN